MRYGLAGRLAHVDADVEAVGLVIALDDCLERCRTLEERRALERGCFEELADVSPRHDERVAGRNWICVPNADDRRVAVDQPVGGNRAERADVENARHPEPSREA